MTVIRTADRVAVSVIATESGDWQVVSTPTGFQGIDATRFADNDLIHGTVKFEDGEGWEVYDDDDGSGDHLLEILNVSGTVTIARPSTPLYSSNNDDRVDAGSGTHTLFISLGSASLTRFFRETNPTWKTLTSADSTPSVADYVKFKTNGTTAITRFDDMEAGQPFMIRRGGSDIVIQHDGSNISLANAANLTLTTVNPVAYFIEDSGVAVQVGLAGPAALPLAGGTMLGTLVLAGNPSGNNDASNKAYVDAAVAGLNYKANVVVATTANITLSGEQTIDGVLTSASRVLVKDQSSTATNGIYVSAAGSWTRSTDFDAWTELPGSIVAVQRGSVNANTLWECTVDDGGTIGVTAITFVEFFGGALAASLVSYSNTASKLLATTAQAAIDEIWASVTTNGDADHTITATEHSIVTTATLTANRTLTLPAANTVAAGATVWVNDVFGGIGTYTLTVARAGSDTIEGLASAILTSQFGSAGFKSDGTSKWIIVAGIGKVRSNGTAWLIGTYVDFVDDVAALVALDVAKLINGERRDVGGARAGRFKWDSSDLSATLVAATITSATGNSGTDLFTKSGFNQECGVAIMPTSSTAELTSGTIYYLSFVSGSTFKIAPTYSDARKATNLVNLSDSPTVTFKVLLDPLGAIYLIPTGKARDGSQGAWVRMWDEAANTIDVTWAGAVSDSGSTDNLHIIQSCIEMQCQRGGGNVLVPAASGYYAITYCMRERDNVSVLLDGHIKNTITAVNADSKPRSAIFVVAGYVSTIVGERISDETFYSCVAPSAGDTTLELTSHADAANFTADTLVFIRSNTTTDLGNNNIVPDYSEINRVVSVNTGAGTVTFENPLIKDLAACYIANTSGNALSSTVGCRIKAVDNFKVLGRGRGKLSQITDVLYGLFTLGASYKMIVDGINIDCVAFSSTDGQSHARYSNIVGIVRRKFVEIGQYCVDFGCTNFNISMQPGHASPSFLIGYDQWTRRAHVRNGVIDAGTLDGVVVVQLGNSFDCLLEGVTIHCENGSALQSIADTVGANGFVCRGCHFIVSGANRGVRINDTSIALSPRSRIEDTIIECNGTTVDGVRFEELSGYWDLNNVTIRNPTTTGVLIKHGCTDISLDRVRVTGSPTDAIKYHPDVTNLQIERCDHPALNLTDYNNYLLRVHCASTANLTLSGEQTIDGFVTSTSRVLVKNQSTASQNGVYTSAAGAWSRTTDADTWAELQGAVIPVAHGTVAAGKRYVAFIIDTGTVGSDSITFTEQPLPVIRGNKTKSQNYELGQASNTGFLILGSEIVLARYVITQNKAGKFGKWKITAHGLTTTGGSGSKLARIYMGGTKFFELVLPNSLTAQRWRMEVDIAMNATLAAQTYSGRMSHWTSTAGSTPTDTMTGNTGTIDVSAADVVIELRAALDASDTSITLRDFQVTPTNHDIK